MTHRTTFALDEATAAGSSDSPSGGRFRRRRWCDARSPTRRRVRQRPIPSPCSTNCTRPAKDSIPPWRRRIWQKCGRTANGGATSDLPRHELPHHGSRAGSREGAQLRGWIAAGETLITPMPAWFEFQCGPVTPIQLATMRAFLAEIVSFGEQQAAESPPTFQRRRPQARLARRCHDRRHRRRGGARDSHEQPRRFQAFTAHGSRCFEFGICGGHRRRSGGLARAEVLAENGAAVTVFDAKASVGRKFLVAGGGGLNLTKAEPPAPLRHALPRPGNAVDFWLARLAEFGPTTSAPGPPDLVWKTFAASTGRVYPREMKAAPLLRNWVRRLRGLGVRFAMHHRLAAIRADGALEFHSADGPQIVAPRAAILALGGGSWPETGSDGGWVTVLEKMWHRSRAAASGELRLGSRLAGRSARRGGRRAAQEYRRTRRRRAGEGRELVITRYGLEGGAIYQLGRPPRDGATVDRDRFEARPHRRSPALEARPARRNWLSRSRNAGSFRRRRCDPRPPSRRGELDDRRRLDRRREELPRRTDGSASARRGDFLRRRRALERTRRPLMLRKLPGVFMAGEMIDWEAPTGGYPHARLLRHRRPRRARRAAMAE